MKFNVSKSVTIIFPPHKTSRRAKDNFPPFKLDGQNKLISVNIWVISYLH